MFVIMFLLLVGYFPLFSETRSSDEGIYRMLDNGLSYFIQERDNIPMVNIVFIFDAGSKDEEENTNGIIHILEHLLYLSATNSHTTDELTREMRSRGGAFNAHTNNDYITFELSLPSPNWEFGLRFLKEKLFNIKFSAEQLEKEKKVIFEEMPQHQDNPNLFGLHTVLQNLFKDHPYSRPITGKRDIIEKITIEEIGNFYSRHVIPSNGSLTVVGDIKGETVDKSVQNLFGNLEKKVIPKTSFSMVPPLKSNIRIEKKMDVPQGHLIFGFLAPPSEHPDQVSFDVLNQVLSKGPAPLLRSALNLRGQPLLHGLTTYYIPLQYGGAYIIHTTLEPKSIKTVERELIKFLFGAWNFPFSIDNYNPSEHVEAMDYLKNAIGNIQFYYEESQELGMNSALSYAKYLLYHKETRDESKIVPYMTRVEKVSSSDLKEMITRYFSGKKYITILILPTEKK